MPSFFQIKSFITYWLDCVDEHSLHSPFFYDFYTRVVKAESAADQFAMAEKLRNNLLGQSRTITVEDLGAGSAELKSSKRNIGDIARTSLSPVKYSQLYARIVKNFGSKNIIELGTSFGINTLYLATPQQAYVTTFEGAPEIAAVAKITFEFAEANNIQLVEGNINNTLPPFLLRTSPIDLVFLDANHRYEPTLKYFNLLLPELTPRSVMILDDIHYSAEMKRAWDELKKHKLVYASVDLFRCGILFFDPSLNKQHVILQF